jgi:hypothetical protein
VWRPRAVNAKSVLLSGPEAATIPVPTECRHLGQIMACFSAVIIEKAEFYTLCNAGEQRKIDPISVVRGAKWVRFTGTQSHDYLMSR